jgi:hypothetical protein
MRFRHSLASFNSGLLLTTERPALLRSYSLVTKTLDLQGVVNSLTQKHFLKGYSAGIECDLHPSSSFLVEGTTG